jgi:predicted alpha/beta superfamily hydrolase
MTILPLSDGSGVVTRHPALASRHVATRNVDVWCPPGYEADSTRRYPVIYMHDGQNVFDPALSFTGIDWGVDEAIAGLMRDEQLPGAIVVGIWNTEERWREYMPARPLSWPAGEQLRARLAAEGKGAPLSDAYLKFIVEELKPLIDGSYRTLPGQAHTFLMGSSMGGLISLYGLVEHPQVFGGAACLSTHWPAGEDLLVAFLGAVLPPAGHHRLYFDYGSEGIDAEYEPYQRRVDALCLAAGYTQGRDWRTEKFPGAEHNERAWRARVRLPLAFLLG